MKILFVSHSDSLGGANQSMLQLIKGLIKVNVEVIVLIPKGTGGIANYLESLRCEVIIADYSRCVRTPLELRPIFKYFSNDKLIKSLCNTLKDEGIQIVHSNGSICDVGAIIARTLKINHVWHVREVLGYYDFLLIRPRFHKKLMREAKKVICISKYIENYAKCKYHIQNTKVIYNGFEVNPTHSDYYETKCISDNEKCVHNIIIAGAIYKNKGHEDAIRALNLLVKKYKVDNVKLLIVGTQRSTKRLEDKLKRLVHSLDIDAYVSFMPFCGPKELSEIRKGCDIALQCSRMEGMGRITIESMLEGLFVIGVKSGGTEELIQEGINGWLYEPGKSEQLAEKIMHVLNCKDRELIRETAYNWAVENFSNDRIVSEFMGLYEEIIKENKKSSENDEGRGMVCLPSKSFVK